VYLLTSLLLSTDVEVIFTFIGVQVRAVLIFHIYILTILHTHKLASISKEARCDFKLFLTVSKPAVGAMAARLSGRHRDAHSREAELLTNLIIIS
jgi:hypothetical protein